MTDESETSTPKPESNAAVPVEETVKPARGLSRWAWGVLIVWLAWIVALAWMGRTEWGAPRPADQFPTTTPIQDEKTP